jgi:hypothetical protein
MPDKQYRLDEKSYLRVMGIMERLGFMGKSNLTWTERYRQSESYDPCVDFNIPIKNTEEYPELS